MPMKEVRAAAAACLISVILLAACAGKDGGSPASSKASSVPASSAPSSGASSEAASSEAGGLERPEDDPMYVKAYQYYITDRYDQAVSVCDSALAKNPKVYWAYNIKGIAIYFANGNSKAEKALELIGRSIEMAPDYYYAYFNEALIYKGLMEFDKSLECFNRVLALKPDDTWSYYGIATIYGDERNAEKALEYLRKAVVLDPSVKNEARTERHFVWMHDNPEFQALVG